MNKHPNTPYGEAMRIIEEEVIPSFETMITFACEGIDSYDGKYASETHPEIVKARVVLANLKKRITLQP
jgi:hypothetical protein